MWFFLVLCLKWKGICIVQKIKVIEQLALMKELTADLVNYRVKYNEQLIFSAKDGFSFINRLLCNLFL